MSFFDSIGNGIATILPIGGAIAGGVFGGPTGAVGGATAGSAASSAWFNYQNAHNQEEQYHYQKALQKQIFFREDTAIGRRMNDLVKNGLSPVLAAGNGASAGSIVQTKAPQWESQENLGPIIMSLLKMKEDISNTIAQRDLIESQTRRSDAEASIKWWDFQKFVESGMPSNASGLSKAVRDLVGLVGSNMVQGPIKDIKDKVNKNIEFNKTVDRYNKAKSENDRLKSVNNGEWWKMTNKEVYNKIKTLGGSK